MGSSFTNSIMLRDGLTHSCSGFAETAVHGSFRSTSTITPPVNLSSSLSSFAKHPRSYDPSKPHASQSTASIQRQIKRRKIERAFVVIEFRVGKLLEPCSIDLIGVGRKADMTSTTKKTDSFLSRKILTNQKCTRMHISVYVESKGR